MITATTPLEEVLVRALVGEGDATDVLEAVLVGLRVDVLAAAELADEGGLERLASPLRGVARRLNLAIDLRRLEQAARPKDPT